MLSNGIRSPVHRNHIFLCVGMPLESFISGSSLFRSYMKPRMQRVTRGLQCITDTHFFWIGMTSNREATTYKKKIDQKATKMMKRLAACKNCSSSRASVSTDSCRSGWAGLWGWGARARMGSGEDKVGGRRLG